MATITKGDVPEEILRLVSKYSELMAQSIREPKNTALVREINGIADRIEAQGFALAWIVQQMNDGDKFKLLVYRETAEKKKH